ncbi:DNA mismatch repair protein Mlh1 [Aricia agestis]|uniref:DNA mismatch repair protein Mlh1 n=1 Tax=Aricia agestis TaxID=91739 RepID=UPI001C2038AF|nr:DNA mismatch repair protein Mlh1 [Aricia agestis]
MEPGIIRKLDEDVVNRIAAGEIVQRPANALKELIENSLDAHATNIIITVKAGGLKYLQIQDNGTGIRCDNLDIVCERFTTSKLKEFEDLQAINTYGFRGEALASISHIAHLSIMTKTAADKCAYKVSYENGKVKGQIKACAGNTGTQITVEDIFYNVVARKKALRSPNEEYTHIMDVVGGYAIHNSKVAFTLKKFGENTDIRTPLNSSTVENVRIVHGNQIARELLEIEIKEPTLKFELHGYITNVNYSHKKGMMLLFINHRMVVSTSIRKAVDSVYSTYLPKNSHSIVYLSIELDPKNVDVNVHPTKHEVQFLYEEQIIDKIKSCVESKLLSCNSSRVMYTQARLPGASAVEEIIKKTTDGAKVYAKDLVRVNADTQKIDKFFRAQTNRENTETSINDAKIAVGVGKLNDNDSLETLDARKTNSNVNDINKDSEGKNEVNKEYNRNIDCNNDKTGNQPISFTNGEGHSQNGKINKVPNIEISNNMEQVDIEENVVQRIPKWSNAVGNSSTYIDPKQSFKTRTFEYERIETKLTSVKQLRMEIESQCNMNLREILANLIFIACIDSYRSLVQHSTKLYLCDTRRLTEELFYETILYDFQNLGFIKLSNALPLEELFVLGLSADDAWDSELGDRRELGVQMVGMLVSKRDMLLEYFSLEMNAKELLALPLLLDGHTPYMGALPTYLVRLVTEVNWESEKECFDTFSRQTAIFYSQVNPDSSTSSSEQWTQEHIIFPAIRKNFLPTTQFTTNGTILQVASLGDLYKVFERC